MSPATPPQPPAHPWIAIVGGGPAGLMAAEVLAREGWPVKVFDAMASVGRKFLLAGKGGMNITHGEAMERFLDRYGPRRPVLEPLLRDFGPPQLQEWMRGLGIDTFVGSSGRVFPLDMKAAPLLRAWLQRLRALGVDFRMRHRWQGWDPAGALRFQGPEGPLSLRPAATVLALGGGSWPRLGSDGAWVPYLQEQQVQVHPLEPSNCGFDGGSPQGPWSPYFQEQFAGQPVKNVAAWVATPSPHAFAEGEEGAQTPAPTQARRGEFLLTASGVEGSLIYALSAPLRRAIKSDGQATLYVDLLPDHSLEQVRQEVLRPRGSRSLSSHLASRLGLKGPRAGLLRECLDRDSYQDPERLAAAIKALPLRLTAPRPLAEAISSAGGVDFADLDPQLMLTQLPGVFCAGEMLDWEAPTGGYLLTACFATGRAAGLGALAWLDAHPPRQA